MRQYKKRLSWQLSKWLATDLGQHVTECEKNCLDTVLTDRLYSETIVIGEMGQEIFLKGLHYNYAGMVAEHQQPGIHPSSMIAKHEQLPIISNTADLIILPHSLDFTKRPHHILKEVDRCLKAEAHIVIIGFSRCSLWWLRQFFSLRLKAPWCGRFKTQWKIKDWLSLLNYEVVKTEKAIFTPPLKPRGFFKYFSFLSVLQGAILPFTAATYVIVARKKIYGLTPLRPKWRAVRNLRKARSVKPASRTQFGEHDDG